jgi:hypothetical protein
MTLDAIIRPGKMIGTAVLLLGIGLGLATIAINLRMQAHALPNLATAAVHRRQANVSDILPSGDAISRRPFVPLFLGFAVVLSAYILVAAPLAWNRASNLTSAGWASTSAQSLEVILEHWIESYILAGISILLFGIGWWLLIIIQNLRLQKERFLGAVAGLSGSEPGPGPAPPRALGMVRVLLAAGLGVALLALGLTGVWIDAGLQAVHTGDPSAIAADHVWGALIKPFKFVSPALIFLAIGLALSVIVINLQMISMVLPGVFASFGQVAQGRKPKPLDLPPIDPMKLFPKRLFVGILVGVAVVVTATLPLAWPLRVETFGVFLGADLVANSAAQGALSLERTLEHLILPYKLAGLGVIFYAIGRYFTTIIGFVRARKAIVTEGVASIGVLVKPPIPEMTADGEPDDESQSGGGYQVTP